MYDPAGALGVAADSGAPCEPLDELEHRLLSLQASAEPHVVAKAKSLLVRLVAMFSKMCR
jgi:hypothetical protein